MAATGAFSMAALNAALPSGVVSTKTRWNARSVSVSVKRNVSVAVRSHSVGFQAFDGLRNENALQLRTG